jgi:hypothetical protein
VPFQFLLKCYNIQTFSDRGQEDEATLKFTDLPSNPAFRTAVVWAVSKNITDGTTPTTCSPENICPRSQAITFIHMANVKIFNGD